MQCPTCRIENSTGATTCSACGTPLSNTTTAPLNITLPQGSSLQNGAFKTGIVLGQGGFGITYKGGDMKLKRYVAIKEFFPQGSVRNTTQVQPTGSMTQANFNEGKVKFIEEARTLAKFNHPGIVRVFDTFEENSTAYMVMELLKGYSLQNILDKKGALSEEAALSAINQVGKALFIVHQAGILHRDIKPDNIIWTTDKRAVLIDFGTARAFTADKTSSMTAMVTQGYAPPEQYSSKAEFGSYTDTYALAATLYHCLTGQPPVSAMDRLNGVKLQSPREINPGISESVSAAVMEAMKLKAADRPQSVQDFLDMLKGKGLPQTTPAAVQPSYSPPSYTSPAINTPPATSKRTGTWIIAMELGKRLIYAMDIYVDNNKVGSFSPNDDVIAVELIPTYHQIRLHHADVDVWLNSGSRMVPSIGRVEMELGESANGLMQLYEKPLSPNREITRTIDATNIKPKVAASSSVSKNFSIIGGIIGAVLASFVGMSFWDYETGSGEGIMIGTVIIGWFAGMAIGWYIGDNLEL